MNNVSKQTEEKKWVSETWGVVKRHSRRGRASGLNKRDAEGILLLICLIAVIMLNLNHLIAMLNIMRCAQSLDVMDEVEAVKHCLPRLCASDMT